MSIGLLRKSKASQTPSALLELPREVQIALAQLHANGLAATGEISDLAERYRECHWLVDNCRANGDPSKRERSAFVYSRIRPRSHSGTAPATTR